MTDLYDAAQNLKIVDVWQPGNETGWTTLKLLYDPTLGKAQRLAGYKHWVDHGTASASYNTLAYWGNGGSANANAGYSLAQYLVPRDKTRYRGGEEHDTQNIVFKMVPPGFCCNHVGYAIGPFVNANSLGVEYESKQNGTHDILESQYVKGALLYAHDSWEYRIPDWFRVMHGLIADNPWGRRTDPWSGKFNIAYSWELVQAIRRDKRSGNFPDGIDR